MKQLLMAVLLGCSLFSYAGIFNDVINEHFEGRRKSNGEVCVLSHRNLEYGPQQIYISFHGGKNEVFAFADAGLVEASVVTYETFQSLMYGQSDISIAANNSIYDYTISSTNKDGKRVITIKGSSKETRNRYTTATVTLVGRNIESISIAKSANTFWGWRNAFSDTCIEMKRIKGEGNTH